MKTGSGQKEPPDELDEVLSLLAAETGRILGELGVRPGDERWIRAHAETISSLGRASRPRRGWLYRFARRAARTAR